MNGLELNELEDGDSYKYLGTDENIRYQGKLNKETVTSEYFRRVRKIWNSELYAKNKMLAHNTFAVPLLTPTFGILDWTKEDVLQMDVKTRKLLCLSGSFHRNSRVDRLYTSRDNGGRGINSVYDAFLARTVALSCHVEKTSHTNVFMNEVKRHEADGLLRVCRELCSAFDITLMTIESM